MTQCCSEMEGLKVFESLHFTFFEVVKFASFQNKEWKTWTRSTTIDNRKFMAGITGGIPSLLKILLHTADFCVTFYAVFGDNKTIFWQFCLFLVRVFGGFVVFSYSARWWHRVRRERRAEKVTRCFCMSSWLSNSRSSYGIERKTSTL